LTLERKISAFIAWSAEYEVSVYAEACKGGANIQRVKFCAQASNTFTTSQT